VIQVRPNNDQIKWLEVEISAIARRYPMQARHDNLDARRRFAAKIFDKVMDRSNGIVWWQSTLKPNLEAAIEHSEGTYSDLTIGIQVEVQKQLDLFRKSFKGQLRELHSLDPRSANEVATTCEAMIREGNSVWDIGLKVHELFDSRLSEARRRARYEENRRVTIEEARSESRDHLQKKLRGSK
jgi:hypothetical protein